MRVRPAFDLFLISWLILFLELTCIRWFPSHVLFLTFFTNIVLLACFVGMSVGCLTARSSVRWLDRTPLWLAVATAIGLVFDVFQGKLLHYVAIGDQANPDVVYFGAEATNLGKPTFRMPVEVIAGGFFLLIATLLVGPGQEMGRAFNRVADRTTAYSMNLLGSLAGIVSFAACSYLQLPPVVWFVAVALGLAYFVVPWGSNETTTTPAPDGASGLRLNSPLFTVGFLALTVIFSIPTSGIGNLTPGRDTGWSPYYRVDYFPAKRWVNTNLVSHQVMEPLDKPAMAMYTLPFMLQRDMKQPDGQPAWPQFKRVLIIGAGSGNDVARATQWLPPDAQIDAVEIDPVIQRLGIDHHPDRPYQDPRVVRHLNDGRNFLRRAEPATYDLVIFALVDSLVLHSGYSNLRLESYLFTEQSFKDVRRALKPTGVCAVYNFFRQGWLVARIRDGLQSAFGVEPVVITLPATPEVGLELFEPRGFTAFLAGSAEVVEPLRAAFATHNNTYWIPVDRPINPQTNSRFGGANPAGAGEEWEALQTSRVEPTNGRLRLATDDWPFLYVRQPGIPTVTWRGMILMLGLSVVLWLVFKPRGEGAANQESPEWGLIARSFLLGAGFMLVETKAVVHMALLFGSTWMVNTVVFAAVLLMSLAGNLFAGWVKPTRLEPYFVGLFAALGLGLFVPLEYFLGLDRTTQIVGACALVFAPIAFAGVIFATSFRRTAQPDRMFGANVAGALIGGLAENTSVLLGFQYLLCVAIGFYALSAVFGNKELLNTAAGKDV